MSFAEQERALFDLLFDQRTRHHFIKAPASALEAYDLTVDELADFNTIRPDALELDAKMRIDLILSQICKSFPISFSIVSSCSQGISCLKKCIDIDVMRDNPISRTTHYGQKLRQKFLQLQFKDEKEKTIASAILEAELGMAWTAANLKQEMLTQQHSSQEDLPLSSDWKSLPVKLASYVTASILPQPYAMIKQQLCPASDAELWRHLNDKPLKSSKRIKTLSVENPRLLVTKAYLSRASRCDPVIDHKTAELSEGFASLFQHINGSMSVEGILNEMRKIGANESILQGINNAFSQLMELRMLELSN